MRIGEAAARAGVTRDTLRYYERHGLLPPAPRRANGYRDYPDTVVDRVQTVRRALRFGFTVREIAGFFRARDGGRPPCREVRRAGERLLADVERQLAQLAASRDAIRETLADWDARLAVTAEDKPARLLEHVRLPRLPPPRSRPTQL
jgi:DNA-binding transcriptional MerR regulator